jgi:BCD family chlorophyll transporter-like MFS transporter
MLGWFGIVRLGLVQAALGAIVVLTSSTLNRVMVVELALPASLPAALVAWHYVLQLSRPAFGHRGDGGRRRTPWIVAGMGTLALGALLATNATLMMAESPVLGTIAAVIAFSLIGAGVGASGTSLLALLATAVAPERRPAAAAITWIMMIVGIVITAATSGSLLDPYSPQRLALVASGVTGIAFLLTLVATWGLERDTPVAPHVERPPLAAALREVWSETLARNFTIFVFVSMLAYSAQDLILEPYAGLVFGYTLGESTKLTGVQHSGVLAGMVLVGLIGTLIRGDKTEWMKLWTLAGCVASALALGWIAMAGVTAQAAMFQPAVFGLGFANGVFAVSAIGLMMSFAGTGTGAREGTRMGLWGAAQAMAFGAGGFAGALGLDIARQLMPSTPAAFATVFVAEAALFLAAALLVRHLGRSLTRPASTPAVSYGAAE